MCTPGLTLSTLVTVSTLVHTQVERSLQRQQRPATQRSPEYSFELSLLEAENDRLRWVMGGWGARAGDGARGRVRGRGVGL